MSPRGNGPNDAAKLRWRAEEVIRKRHPVASPDPQAWSEQETQKAIHELQVHQVELDMQNEELRRTHEQLETTKAHYSDLYDLAPVGYCILSPEGLITECNQAAVTMLQVPRAALMLQPITRYILAEDQDIYYLQRKAFLKTGQPHDCELRMVNHQGASFWVHLSAVAVSDPPVRQGEMSVRLPETRLVLSDISERKRMQEEKSRLEALLQLAQNNAPEPDLEAPSA